MSGEIVALSLRERNICSRSEQPTLRLGRHVVIGRALLAYMACASLPGAPVAGESPAADVKQFDKSGPVDGAGLVPAPPAVGEYTPEEQAQLAEAEAKNQQVAHLYSQGRFAEAIVLAWEVLAIFKEILGEQHPDYATSLNDTAVLYDSMGDYPRAEPLHRQALEIRKVVLGELHPHYAQSLDNLAALYQSMGDYARAEPLHRQALEIYKQVLGERHPDYATSLNNLAALYRAMGDYARAEPLYQQASDILKSVLGERHPEYATSLNNLAELYRVMGDYARAEPLSRQTLEIKKAVLGERHPAYATSLNNLAALYDSMGDYARAESLYRQALEIRRQVLGERHREYADSLNNLAGVYYSMGDYARAEPLYEQALQICMPVLGERHPNYARMLASLGAVHAAQGDFRLAGDEIETSLAINQSVLRDVFALSTESEMRAYLLTLDGSVDGLLSLPADGADRMHDSLTWILRRKAIVFEMMSQFRAAELLAAADAEIADMRSQLLMAQSQLENLLVRPQADRPEQLVAQKAELDETIARLNDDLHATLSTYLGDDISLMPTIDGVRAALPDGGALVEIVKYTPFNFQAVRDQPRWGEPRYVAFVLFQDESRSVERVDLGEAAAIDELASRIGQHMADVDRDFRMVTWSESEADYRTLAQALQRRAWAPIAEKLGYVRNVFLSPDGPLHGVAFDTLVNDDGEYLVEEDYSFAYLTSGRDLLRADRALGSGVYVFAGPDFRMGHAARYKRAGELLTDLALSRPTASDSTQALSDVGSGLRGARSRDARLGWRLLPNALKEGKEAAAAFADADFGPVGLFAGADAIEDVVKQLHGPRVLIFPTHGETLTDQPRTTVTDATRWAERLWTANHYWAMQRLYVQENPLLRSFLVLAGANLIGVPLPDDIPADQLEDGLLTADEVSQLDLRGTDLVVLSACRSGLGTGGAGEAIAGMRSAFLYAGARTLVVTLYKVPDLQTRELMGTFYNGVADGEGKLAALNRARREYIETLRSRHDGAAHPFLWGSFVLVGEP